MTGVEIETENDKEMEVEGCDGKDGSVGGEADKKRDSFDRGVLIKGEFAFVRAVGNFCKSSVQAGRFKGNYNFNVKEQMEM
jgi:hypothetical protein